MFLLKTKLQKDLGGNTVKNLLFLAARPMALAAHNFTSGNVGKIASVGVTGASSSFGAFAIKKKKKQGNKQNTNLCKYSKSYLKVFP